MIFLYKHGKKMIFHAIPHVFIYLMLWVVMNKKTKTFTKEVENLPKKTLKTYKSFFFLNAEMDIVAFVTVVEKQEKILC